MKQRKKICQACSPNAPKAPTLERAQFQSAHPDWRFLLETDVEKLRREFPFDNYREATEFAIEIAELADFEDHHPAILLEWGRVTISWWTHKIGGIHTNDLLMAQVTDELYAERLL